MCHVGAAVFHDVALRAHPLSGLHVAHAFDVAGELPGDQGRARLSTAERHYLHAALPL